MTPAQKAMQRHAEEQARLRNQRTTTEGNAELWAGPLGAATTKIRLHDQRYRQAAVPTHLQSSGAAHTAYVASQQTYLATVYPQNLTDSFYSTAGPMRYGPLNTAADLWPRRTL